MLCVASITTGMVLAVVRETSIGEVAVVVVVVVMHETPRLFELQKPPAAALSSLMERAAAAALLSRRGFEGGLKDILKPSLYALQEIQIVNAVIIRPQPNGK